MKPIKKLKGKKIALVGLGASQIDFVIGLENSKEWDEVWVINSALAAFDYDRVFMMDPASRYLDTDDAGNQTDVMRKLLPLVTKPIYSCVLDERVPAIVEYPLAEVATSSKCAYLNTTAAYAVAFALWNKVGQVDLFGMDFSYKHNIHFAEAGRACMEFWLSKCISAGIVIGASPRSSLLDSDVPVTERLYGYHRLDDPMVAMPSPEGKWILCPRSRLAEMVAKHKMKTIELPSSPEPYKG
tara:strand:- start:740 stop:1462 length:723 start_codon:yes stop_codon:yes gene_type:complete